MARPAPRYTTAVEYISSELRQEILRGTLEPGDRLILDQQAERFGTSPIPVREALRILEAEGLVVMQAHRSATVAGLSAIELEDLYRVRQLVDVEAVRWAHGKLTDQDFDAVHTMIDKMQVLLAARDDFEAFDLHRQIHFRIYAGGSSPILMTLLQRLHEQSERFRHVAKSVRGSPKAVAGEHRTLLEAMRTGTADDAAALMTAHLLRTLNAIKRARVS